VKARLDVNVALNRPSYHVSDYTDNEGVTFYAKYGNDGINETSCYGSNKHCTVTGLATNPWWAVDLGVALHVWGVMFTNLANTVGMRFSFLPSLADTALLHYMI